jgi:hypothetical protein
LLPSDPHGSIKQLLAVAYVLDGAVTWSAAGACSRGPQGEPGARSKASCLQPGDE